MTWRVVGLGFSAIMVMGGVAACGGNEEPSAAAPATESVAPATSGEPTPASPVGGFLTVNLEDPAGGGAYRFSPSELGLDAGQTVTLTLTSGKELHTFTVDALEIDETVEADATVTFVFNFEEPGNYELICRIHQSLGMVGTIAVRTKKPVRLDFDP